MSISKSSRLITFIFLPILVSLVISAIVSLQLFQDGSSYLFELLVSHSAIRHHRLSVFLIQAPIIVTDKLFTKFQVDSNNYLQILRLIFSLTYSLIPFISLFLAWLVVRRKNEGLFIWAVLIILFINLVNFSWVSEILISLQLSCALLLASILRPGSRLFWILIIILLPIVFFLHPLVLFIFVTIAIGSAYVSYREVKIRKAAQLSAIIFFIAAILRGILNFYALSAYETSFMTSGEMNNYLFITSLENKLFLIISLAIGLICLLAKSINSPLHNKLKLLYASCISLAAIAACLLLSQYLLGSEAFPLKTGLALFASMLIMLMASIDSIQIISHIEFVQRFRLATAISIIFSVVIISKSLMWWSSIQKLEQSLSMSNSPCIELASMDFTWLERNPYKIINNWSLPSLALVIQDNYPRKLLLEKNNCEPFYKSGMVQIDPWTNIPKNLVFPPLP